MSFLDGFFSSAALSPHGFCLLWQPALIWLHVASDTVIGVAYYTIPVALGYFVWKRGDIVFGWMFWMFAAFILACGTTHWFEVWTLWHADYGTQGLIKAVTAVLSLGTAALIWPLLPRAIALPSAADLRRVNEELSVQVRERNQAVEALQREMVERQHAEDALRQSQKLEALGQLTGGVAHDFNNLLLILGTNLYLLREQLGGTEIEPQLASMERAIARAESLTRHLLTFGRRQALQPRPTELRGQVAKLADLLRRSLREDIEIRLDVPPGIWPIEIDRGEFELAIINLALNARDAMPESGVLSIGASNETLRRNADAAEALEGDFVAITVNDTGLGIPPDIVARVFEPFFTTKDVGKGTGLGLSQVYGFAKQSGGDAIVRSEEGRGTTVTLFLPRATRAPSVTTEIAGSDVAPPHDGKKATVLLVEDNADVAEVSAALLGGLGYIVRVATSAQTALDRFAAGETADLVFSDVVMPGGMNGLDLARTLRTRYPGLPVLLATGFGTQQQVVQSGFPLLLKPYRAKALASAIETLLHAGRCVS
jgi:signal transduction histidine kinase/CheY-like chemotaxis protein